MSQRKEDIDLLNKLTGDNASDAGSEQEVMAYEKILDTSNYWKVQYPLSTFESFDRLANKVGCKPPKRNSTSRLLAIAAAVAVTLVSTFALLSIFSSEKIESGMAEIRTVYLPDSSKVVLGANSHISYQTSDWNDGDRFLHLSGHAFFEVQKGSKFRVHSNKGIVSVLGTSFNIFDRADNYEVECFTGKVKVENENSSVFLTQGLRTSLNTKVSQLKEPHHFDIDKRKEWINGVFNFYDMPVQRVFKEIERQYDVEVIIEKDIFRSYTGTFNIQNLDQALNNVCKPLGLKFQFENKNTIKIYSQSVN